MRSSRLSIRSVLFLIAIFGVGFAALKHPSELWSGGLLLGDLCLFVFATVAICYRQGRRRAFWVGFALFGWSYLAVGFAPGVENTIRPHLLTTKLLERVRPRENALLLKWVYLSKAITARSVARQNALVTRTARWARAGALTQSSGVPTLTTTGRSVWYRALSNTDTEEFYRVGQALWALLAAVLGGGIARLLFVARTNRHELRGNRKSVA